VTLPDQKRLPQEPQPGSPIPPVAYFLADVWLTSLVRSTYRKRRRQVLAQDRPYGLRRGGRASEQSGV
jgi:hypothetical protein